MKVNRSKAKKKDKKRAKPVAKSIRKKTLKLSKKKAAAKTVSSKKITREKKNRGKTAARIKPEISLPRPREPQFSMLMTSGKISNFDPLDMLRRILMAEDMLFLSRQITYHISTEADLPGIWGDRDKIGQAFVKLIDYLARRADRGTKIKISISQFALRSGPGIKISFESHDRNLDNINSQEFLDRLVHGTNENGQVPVLYNARQIVVSQRGQMWADLPVPNHPVYHILLPASEEAAKQPSNEQMTFKYDISITNYANVRKRFGITKSASLVEQIGNYVRSLVRYPIDMVMSISDKGMITAIYETQKGSANSVASRISQRLAQEQFMIGKRPVDLMFRYNLALLTSSPGTNQESKSGR
ncbi:MAG TPA: hypothetical protein PKU96_06105 [bacterium]|nr:hypothetical protein [bacterium]